MVNLVGRELGRCTVLRAVPSQHTDDVYVVRQAASGAESTVRIVHAALAPADPLARPAASAAFAQAAAQVAALDQPHILPLYDFGERDGLRYVIWPAVPAGSLADYLAPGAGHLAPLLLSTTAVIAGQAAAALQHAHDADQVHSTLNLHTLLLLQPPDAPGARGRGAPAGEPRIGLADFGLSRYLPGSSLAQPRAPVLECAAPEECGGAAIPASDQYALGCVIYLLLTGQTALSSGGSSQPNTPRPSQLNPALPPAVDEVLLTALRPDPAERYPRVLDFATALWSALRPAAYAQRAPAVTSVPNARGASARRASAIAAMTASGADSTDSAIRSPMPARAEFGPVAPSAVAPSIVRRAPLGAARFEEDPREDQITRRRALLTLGVLGVAGVAAAGGGYYAIRHHLFGPAASTGPAFHSARDGIGIFRPSASTFSLVESWQDDASTLQVVLGQPGDQPLVGDWDGTGVERIGVYRPSSGQFLLKGGNSTSAPLAHSITFGQPGDLALAGDWLGKGRCGIGVFRPATGTFLLKQTLDSQPPDLTITFGAAGDIPLAGDWDGDGVAGIGVYRASLDQFFLINTLANNAAPKPDYTLALRTGPGLPFAGRWITGGKRAGVGMLLPAASTTYLKLDASQAGLPDTKFTFGQTGDLPVSGRWAR